MNIFAVFGYAAKHGEQISALFGKGKGADSHIAADIAAALAPVIKKHWPQIDQDDLVDDTVSLMRDLGD